jgi:hypothetical protein
MFIQHAAFKANSIYRGNYWVSSLWLLTQQVNYLSYILHSSSTWKNGNTIKQCTSFLLASRKLMIPLGGYVLFNILTEFGTLTKLVRLINMCLNETYSRVRVGKYLSNMVPVRNGLKQEDALSHFFSILLYRISFQFCFRICL